jgi:hypothetical protein
MGSKMQEELRAMKLDVPQELMCEIAELIAGADLEACVTGSGEDGESVSVSGKFTYVTRQRHAMMEILERMEDYKRDSEEETEN